MKLKNTTKANILFAMLTFTMIISGLGFGIVYGFALDITANEHILNIFNELSLIIAHICMMIPALIYICALKAETAYDIRFKMPGGRQVIIIILVTILLLPVVSIINLVTSIGVESAGESISDVFLNMPYWKALFYVAIVPGVVEEFLTRGLLYYGFRRRNKFVAIIISAAMFGIIHMNFNQFAYAFFLGIILAVIVEITGTLWSSIIVHVIFNGINVTMAYVPLFLEKYINMDAQLEEVPVEPIVLVTQNIYSVIILLGMATVSMCIIILLLKLLAKISGSSDNMKYIFSKEGRKTYHEEGRTIDWFFVLGLVPAVGYMILYEIIIRVTPLIAS